MIEALKKHLGRVTRACEEMKIVRQTHYNWIRDDSEYKAAVDDVNEAAIDHVESKLFEKIDGVTIKTGVDKEGNDIVYDVPPSDTAIIFYLKTKGKKRGYVERQELTGGDGGPIQIIVPDSL